MPLIAKAPGAYAGQAVGSGHCVAFVQAAAGVPNTARWRRGIKVKGSDSRPGTAIATFSHDGRYENKTDGSSHAAILIAEQPGGLQVWDQWRGHLVQQRVIRYKGGQGTANNDGDMFHVIESEET
jgi:hypothetical protein